MPYLVVVSPVICTIYENQGGPNFIRGPARSVTQQSSSPRYGPGGSRLGHQSPDWWPLLLAGGRFWKGKQGWEDGQRRKLTSLGACLRSSRLARWVLGTLIADTIFTLRTDPSRRRGEEQAEEEGGEAAT